MAQNKTNKTPITIAYGDGIGPEIMAAVLKILDAADARIAPEEIKIGESQYKNGINTGIEPAAWESLKRTKVFLKAPITTPQGGGYKSLNVTIRKTLGLYANIRPCVSYDPFVPTKHPDMDVVIIRENEEDLYAGVEYRQTPNFYQCLKMITRPGCERIIRYAFDYARANNRKKVTAFVKDNIMKLTDGAFHDIFKEIAPEYPEIEADHFIVDIGSARRADTPNMFDVIVTLNLYGDIISDIAAQIAGSVGLAGSSNIGQDFAMFEAIHGSAPPIAGKNIANPSGLLHGAILMLVHIGQGDIAEKIHNAWLCTLEEGFHTADIFDRPNSTRRCLCDEFGEEIIKRLGQEPKTLTPVRYDTEKTQPSTQVSSKAEKPVSKKLKGVDIFIQADKNISVDEMSAHLNRFTDSDIKLDMISSRGLKIWPNSETESPAGDAWRCRFLGENGKASHKQIIALLSRMEEAKIDFIKTENLCAFDDVDGWSQ